MASEKAKPSDKNKKLTQQQIIMEFNQLRSDQKQLVTKLAEVEQELNEHSLVVDVLRDVDPERTCYRMIGGVLVERTVKEVLPAVANNKEGLTKIIDALNKQIEDKGKELKEYVEKHDIQIRKDGPNTSAPTPEDTSSEGPQPSSSVLVKSES